MPQINDDGHGSCQHIPKLKHEKKIQNVIFKSKKDVWTILKFFFQSLYSSIFI